MIVEAQATPRLANKVIEKVREVTDKPSANVVLDGHYHAVRVLSHIGLWGGNDQSCSGRRPPPWSKERGQEQIGNKEFQPFSPRLLKAMNQSGP